MKGQAGSLALIAVLLVALAGLLFLAGTYARGEIRQSLLDSSQYIAPAAWSVAVLAVAVAARMLLFVFLERSLEAYPADLVKSLKVLASTTIFSVALLVIIAFFTRGEMIFSIVVGGFVIMALIASKEFLEDFARRFMLLSSDGVNLGDYVSVEGVSGKVVEFGVIYTTIRKDDNTLCNIPNRKLVESCLVNYSKAPHLKVQDSIELAVDKRGAEKISREIQQEIDGKGFKKYRVNCFKAGSKVRFVASISIDEPAQVKHASESLTKILKKTLREHG